MTLRYAYDKSTQDRQGGARATWEIGPKNIFTLPNGQLFNTNPHAQAYENAFGILYDDFNVVSGYPGGLVDEYETRVAHATNGLYLDLDRQTFDAQWDITDKLRFHAIAGRREQDRRLMVDFDSDTRVFFADRQDNDEIIEDSYELQFGGTHGDREQFNWTIGYYANERSAKSRVPTFSGVPFACDLLVASTIRGVTDSDRAECFNDRMRALNVQNQFVATPQMTAAQIGAMWNQVVALGPNYRGVTPAVFTNAMAGPSTDLLNIAYDETEAVFADLSWDITEKLTLGFGMRTQTDTHLGTDQIRHGAGVAATTTNILEPFPWNDPDYNLRDPFGYSAINTPLAGASEFDGTPARLSVQYQFTDDVMAYVTLADGYQPGGTTIVPANILVLNAAGVATGGLLRDVYNTNPAAMDLPYQLVRGEQTVDNFEVGIKADWLDGRFRTNVTVFQTDWENMTGSTYVATVWWDLDGNGFAEARVPCAARCDGTNTYEVNYFPNLLTSAVLEAEVVGHRDRGHLGRRRELSARLQLRIARHRVRRARPGRRRHGACLQRRRQVRGRTRHDGQSLGAIRLVAQGRAQPSRRGSTTRGRTTTRGSRAVRCSARRRRTACSTRGSSTTPAAIGSSFWPAPTSPRSTTPRRSSTRCRNRCGMAA